MILQGSCHCRRVMFTVESAHPFPFNLCYCEVCRKTAGAGGFAINLGARYETLSVEGGVHIRTYRAMIDDGAADDTKQSPAERKFCGECGSALWLWDPRWPELVHPHASAIDSDLPTPPQRVHFMLANKASWVRPCVHDVDQTLDGYPAESIAAWHQRRGLERTVHLHFSSGEPAVVGINGSRD